MRRIVLVGIAAVMVWTSQTQAVNSVVVESKEVVAGATDVVIPIFLTNDQSLKSVVVPLVFRELTPGAFITSLELSWGDRLQGATPLGQVKVKNQYAEEDGNCKNNQPGGFHTLVEPQSPYLPPNDVTSPEGVLFARQKIFGLPLEPGTDTSGSFVMTVDISSTLGTFEIDTTCVDPAIHLYFLIDASSQMIVPIFTKGIITIRDCIVCPHQGDIDASGYRDAIDIALLNDVVFHGGIDPKDQGCSTSRADVDCNTFADAVDLAFIIDHVFFGGAGPCDPCAP